jgi:two-component system chemotaxis response regulator CheB
MSLSAGPLAAERRPREDAIRVMVVDDSVVVRGLVSRWLAEEPELAVVAALRHGRQAVDEIARHAPDVVVLDVEMPEMDGLTALPLLLKATPGVAVIVASTLTRRNADISLRCLSLGARDYVAKPETNSGVTTSSDFRREIVDKVKTLGAAVRRRRAGRAAAASPAAASVRPQVLEARQANLGAEARRFSLRPFSAVQPRLLAIGSSTGGPQALMDVLKACKPIFPRVPVVITQHMPATFTAILAEHLARVAGVEAHEATEGEPLRANRIYVAPGGLHLSLARAGDQVVAKLGDGPAVNFCKPAVDPLFDSVAAIYGPAALAVVLTGMGHDGAKGAAAIVAAGGSVLAQDEATSVVWGMPGAVAQAGAACAVLPLDQIAPKIVQLVAGARV